MRLLENSGRSIFFDVSPICQPVTGGAWSGKKFFLNLNSTTRLVSTTPTLPTTPFNLFLTPAQIKNSNDTS